jgi:hypothetical protein
LNYCNVYSTLCDRYPIGVDEFGNFNIILSNIITEWESNNIDPENELSITSFCDYKRIRSEWFVDITISGVNIIQLPFFNGRGYNTNHCGTSISSGPCLSDWDDALETCLNQMISLGYDWRYETDVDGTPSVRIWYTNCTTQLTTIKTIDIKVGVRFNVPCGLTL